MLEMKSLLAMRNGFNGLLLLKKNEVKWYF